MMMKRRERQGKKYMQYVASSIASCAGLKVKGESDATKTLLLPLILRIQ